MNNQPDNRGGAPRGTGNFKVNIDESRLGGGNSASPPRGGAPGYGQGDSNKRLYYSEKELKAERKAHKKRDRIKAKKNRRVFSVVWLVMVLLLSFTLATYLIGGSNDFFAIDRVQSTAEVTIPENVTLDELTDLLSAKGVIGKPEFFKLYCGITADIEHFQAGVYSIDTNLDYEDIINRLQGGSDNREVVTVTFPEGLNALAVGALLEENEVCTQADFLAALNDIDFSNYDMIGEITNGSEKYYVPEGYLFPDTYEFFKGEELVSVIGKMLNTFQTRITSDIQAEVNASGMTLDEVIVMASIIQAEAADVKDMSLVSAVLHNRLNFGADYGIYGLACDSTIYYPYKVAADIPESGALPYGNYNTYDTEKVSGLPAGAICNPGIDAIKAALRPETAGDAPYYLYFCHSADGTAYYATTAAGHEENLVLAGLV